MARSLDALVKEQLGSQVVQILALTAEVEQLREQLAATQAAPAAVPPVASTSANPG